MFYRLLFFSLLFCCACSSTEGPEMVVREWTDLVDNNRFDEARNISTERAKDMLNMIQTFVEAEESSEVSKTDYLSMKCSEKGKKAVCVYEIIEGGDKIRDSFLLAFANGRWLVDIPEGEALIEDDGEVEQLFNDFEKKLDKAYKKD